MSFFRDKTAKKKEENTASKRNEETTSILSNDVKKPIPSTRGFKSNLKDKKKNIINQDFGRC